MKINYGYYRHRLDASDDPKLQNLIDDMGIVALGYYFSLLEIFGRNYAKRNENEIVFIHRRIFANAWRKRVDSCDKVLTKFQLSGLLVFTKTDSTYALSVPNFSKYFGRYKKTEPLELPNKSKVKERKVNKTVAKKVDQAIIGNLESDIDKAINYLNKKTGKNYKSSTKSTRSFLNVLFKRGNTYSEIISVIDKKNEQWKGTEYEKFLRPRTLFGPKFEDYLEEQEENKPMKNFINEMEELQNGN